MKIKLSENIPLELQIEILKKLPTKSLIQFRTVSKKWKSLIDSSCFIAQYSSQQPQLQRLFVSYEDTDINDNKKYIVYADDDPFLQEIIPVTLPLSLKQYYIVGYSHGILCLYNGYHCRDKVFLWNVSIRRCVALVAPTMESGIFGSILGFGVCLKTSDPKIVKITQINILRHFESVTSIPWQVEVFTGSTGAWRNPYKNLPRKSIYFDDTHVSTRRFLYWLAIDRINVDGGFMSIHNLIVSFDITSEEFREVNLPHNLAHENQCNLSISKLRESLVVLERENVPNDSTYVVWMMEDGVLELFTRLFSVNVNALDASIKGFSRSGAPLVEVNELQHGRDSTLLVLYEPCSKHIEIPGIDEKYCSASVYPYMETLLLLDQPNLVFDDI